MIENNNNDTVVSTKMEKLHFNIIMSWKWIKVIFIVSLCIECFSIVGTFITSIYGIQMNTTFSSLVNMNQHIIIDGMLLMLIKTLDLSKIAEKLSNIIGVFRKK